MADDEKTMEERLAALEAELKSEREGRSQDKARLETYEGTLRALGQQNQPPQRQAEQSGGFNYGMVPVTADDIRFYKSLYPQSTDEQITEYARMRKAELAYEARPIVNNVYGALGSAADALDLHNALLEVEDYKPNRKEVEEYIREARSQGRAVDRKEATQIVKARKLPELVQAEVERRNKAEDERRASAGSAATESGSVGSARPSPAAAPSKKLTDQSPEERDATLAGMSASDRVKALEAEIGDTPIP